MIITDRARSLDSAAAKIVQTPFGSTIAARLCSASIATVMLAVLLLGFSSSFASAQQPDPADLMRVEKTADPDTYSAVGDEIDYTYTLTNISDERISLLSVTDDHVNSIDCGGQNNIDPGTDMTCTGSYTITQQDLDACHVTNTATVLFSGVGLPTGGVTIQATATATATSTTCTPDPFIRSFLKRRVDLLASNEPDWARMMRRFNRGVRPADSDSASPMKLMGRSDASASDVRFTTSLSQIAQANRIAEQKKIDSVAPMGLGGRSTGAPAYTRTPGLDVWAEGHFQHFDDELSGHGQDGKFGILWVGADYLVSPSLLIGALVQFDWMDERTPSLDDAEVRGRGWMVGPYATLKLSDHLFFDARAAWGESDNDLTQMGADIGSFDTERWLARANLTGNWNFGNLYVSPSVAVVYVEEEADSYVDSNGVTIAGQSVRLGRLTFGPEFRYKSHRADGSILEPHISFTGMWDFDEDDDADVADVGGLLVSDDDFRVKIEAGLLAHMPKYSAASFRATVSYDGIGDDEFSAWGGQIWVNWPLH